MDATLVDNGFCVERHTELYVCIPDDLYAAWMDHEATMADASDFTLAGLFRAALVDFLRSVGHLPKPYV